MNFEGYYKSNVRVSKWWDGYYADWAACCPNSGQFQSRLRQLLCKKGTFYSP
jgi:hypothetical protein